MSVRNMSRRGFLKTSAATAALAAAGTTSMGTWTQALAEEEKLADGVKVSASTCNACSNKCGMVVYSRNGRLWKVAGEKLHPYSNGTLCARGHGYSTIGYTDGRVTEPLKRNENGDFEPISWDDAYKEIGEKIKSIMASDGPGKIALVEDPRPATFYTKRFINSFGSPNYYTHGAACNLACTSAYAALMGGAPGPDIGEAECIMFVGRSYGDGVRPSAAHSLAAASERGCKIIMLDPRFNATAHQATTWVAIKPGTDLAFLLAVANVLIDEELYDKQYVADKTTGFEEFAEAMKQYTPKWASEITTISEEQIIDVARTMAKYAPKSFIEQSWRAAVGCSYKNSFETSRMMMIINALLGSFYRKGGMIDTLSLKLGPLSDTTKFKPLPKIDENLKRYGDDKYPLINKGMGSALMVGKGAEVGDIKACFFYNSNPCMGYSNPAKMSEALQKLELMVVIDIQMSETAIVADYILPDTTYIERQDVPQTVGGKKPIIEVRKQGIDKIHENTRPADQIFTELAEACGVGDYFTFTIDEATKALIAPFPEDVQKSVLEVGVAQYNEKPFAYPSYEDIKFKTSDGLFHFVDDVFLKAGLERAPKWIEPLYSPDSSNPEEFRLIGGKQSIHTHTSTTNVPFLIQITKDYGLEKVWMNADRAKALGIEDGDLIEITSDYHTDQVHCKVTQRLHPDCIFTPTGYGVKSPYLKAGTGIGIASMDHTDYHLDPYCGAAMTQENIVRVKKVEA